MCCNWQGHAKLWHQLLLSQSYQTHAWCGRQLFLQWSASLLALWTGKPTGTHAAVVQTGSLCSLEQLLSWLLIFFGLDMLASFMKPLRRTSKLTECFKQSLELPGRTRADPSTQACKCNRGGKLRIFRLFRVLLASSVPKLKARTGDDDLMFCHNFQENG